MILQGKNLIIKAGGVAIAAAKSANIEVQTKTIEVSSPTDGQWEHSIVGSKSWSVSTDHLMANDDARVTMEAVSYSYSGAGYQRQGYVKVGNNVSTFAQTGLTMIVYDTSLNIVTSQFFDLYRNQETAQTALLDFIDNQIIGTGRLWAIYTYDSFLLDATTASAIATALNLVEADVPSNVTWPRTAWSALGRDGYRAISMFEKGNGVAAIARLYLDNNYVPTATTPLKNAVGRVGQVVELAVQVDGLAYDRLSGTAICTKFAVRGNNKSLMEGSFSWKGSGPLT